MNLQITLVNDEVHVIRGVYDWDNKDNIINIYSHISERDENNNIYRDWMHHYKIYKNDVKDINRIGGDDANVL